MGLPDVDAGVDLATSAPFAMREMNGVMDGIEAILGWRAPPRAPAPAPPAARHS